MSFYVKRQHPMTGRVGWTGPLRTESRAKREAGAWLSFDWPAEVVEATPDVKREVRLWQKTADIAHGRRAA